MASMPKMAALVHNEGMEPTIRRGSVAVAEYPQLHVERWHVVGYRCPLDIGSACFIARRESEFFREMSEEQVAAVFRAHYAVFGPMRINRIGRIVGLGGETVELRSDDLYIDGKKASPPVSISTLYSSPAENRQEARSRSEPVLVPDHQVFILQDNLSSGIDSRSVGTVKLTSILGTLHDVIEPEELMRPDFLSAAANRVPKDLIEDLEEQHGPMATWFRPN